MILYSVLTPSQIERKSQLESRKLAQVQIEKRSQLMLGELEVDSIVYHPYYKLGYVYAKVDGGVYVKFSNNYLALLGYQERISAWLSQ